MDWREAIEIVIARTKHEPFRALCDESHPAHEGWRLRVQEMATQPWPPVADSTTIPAPEPELPPFREQVANFASTILDVAATAATTGKVMVSPEAAQARLAVCYGDADRPRCDRLTDDHRCAECGCYMPAKARLAVAACPLDKWLPLGG